MVGQYALAKEDFANILKQRENNVAALKGLAECCYKLGLEHASVQLLARARDDFQEAVDSVTKAIIVKDEYLCVWKILGDICYNVAALPEKYSYLNVIPGLIQSDSKDDSVLIKKKDIIFLATR